MVRVKRACPAAGCLPEAVGAPFEVNQVFVTPALGAYPIWVWRRSHRVKSPWLAMLFSPIAHWFVARAIGARCARFAVLEPITFSFDAINNYPRTVAFRSPALV